MALNPANATTSSVASSATSVTLFASNINARGRSIYNDSTQVLSVVYGPTASSTLVKFKLAAGDYWEAPQPIYTGVVAGIWASANGNARLSEEY